MPAPSSRHIEPLLPSGWSYSPATPALVQTPAGVSSTGTGSLTITFAAATAGNLLYLKVAWNTTTTDVLLSGPPSGWSVDANASINNAGALRSQCFKKIAAGGETSVTVTLASTTQDMAGFVEEWTRVSRMLEDASFNSSTGSTAPPSTGVLSPTTGDMATGLIAIKNNNALSAPTNGYTLIGTVVSGNATAANQVRLASVYNLAPGNTDCSLTEGGTARPYVGQITTFIPIPSQVLGVTVTYTPSLVRLPVKWLRILSQTLIQQMQKSVGKPLSPGRNEEQAITYSFWRTTDSATVAWAAPAVSITLNGTDSRATVQSKFDTGFGSGNVLVTLDSIGTIQSSTTIDLKWQGAYSQTNIPNGTITTDGTIGQDVAIVTLVDGQGSLTFTVAMTRQVAKVLASAATFASALGMVKALNRTLAQTATFTASVVKRAGKPLSQTATFTTVLTKRAAKTLAAGVTMTVGLTKRVGKLLAQTVTATAGMVAAKVSNVYSQTLAVTATFTAAVTKSVRKLLALANTPFFVPPITGFGKAVGKPLAASVTWSTGLVRQTLKKLTQTVTFTAVLTMVKAIGKALAVTVTFTTSLVKSVGKPLAQSVTWTVAMTKGVGKKLALGVTFAVAVGKGSFRVLSVAVTYTAALTKQVGKLLAQAVTFTGSLIKRSGKLLPIGVTFTAVVTKQVGKGLSATVTFTAAVIKRAGKALTQTVTWTAALTTVKAINRVLAVTVTYTMAMIRRAAKRLSQAVTYTGVISRQTAKRLQAVISYLTDVSVPGRSVLDVDVTFVPTIRREIGKLLARGVTFSPALRKRMARLLSVVATFVGDLVHRKVDALPWNQVEVDVWDVDSAMWVLSEGHLHRLSVPETSPAVSSWDQPAYPATSFDLPEPE